MVAISGLLFTSAGTANAESGKRVCGHWYKAYPNNQEVVYFKFFKVNQNDSDACEWAVNNTAKIRDKWGLKWSDRHRFEMATCEWLGQWLYYKYGDDPCPSIPTEKYKSRIVEANATGLWYDSRWATG